MVEQTIIMAGGEGLRLRPLTEHRPKPLMPLLDEPVIGMTLRLLHRHGIRRATVAACYRAEDIRHALGDGSAYGLSLDYAVEESPRGTAGCVKDAARNATGTLLVLSGDGLTDADLTALHDEHVNRGAAMSMVVKRVEDPTGYGVCEVDETGRLTAFREKPADAPRASLVNTGIYFLEPAALARIPETGTFDFAGYLIPAMLDEGVQTIETDAYWRDIGSRESYCQAQNDLLEGRVGLPIHGTRMGSAIMGRDCQVKGVRIAGRCYIGDHACIAPGTVIGPGVVIQPGGIVGERARLENAILWENARIGGGTILHNVVVMPQNGHQSLQRIIPIDSR